MPSVLLDNLLRDFPQSVRDLFALVEKERDDCRDQGVELTVQLNRAREENTTLAAKVVTLQKAYDDLIAVNGASGIVPWGPGTKLETGGVYLMPAAATPLNLRVDVSCTLIVPPGGSLYPNGQAPAIDHKAGLLTVVMTAGAMFHHPNPPKKDGKYDIGACIATASPDGCTLVACSDEPVFGTCDQPVKVLPGAKGVAVVRAKAGADVSSTYFGVWGDCRDIVLAFGGCPDSLTENTVRFSPQNGKIPQRVAVLYSDVGNVGSKSAVDLRDVRGGIAAWNKLRADDKQAALTTGNAKPADPGSDGVWFIENDIEGSGHIIAHDRVDNLVIDGNRINWAARSENNAIYVNATGDLKRLRATGNKGISGAAQKPLLAYHKGQKPPKVDEENNSWVQV